MGVLEGSAVVITGAGRGLGRSYAIAAAAEGAAVVVNDVDKDPAEEVVNEILQAGGRAVSYVGSIADWQGSSDLVATCVDNFGKIDGLVNNAALMHTGSPLDATEDEYRKLVEVNILGTAFVGTHAIRAMAESGGGRIVNITSTAHLGRAHTSIYGMTKGAVASLTYSWALELKDKGITVNGVAPGAATRLTEMFPLTGVQAAELPTPDEVAPLVTYLLSERVPFAGRILRLEKKALRVLDLPGVPDVSPERDSWSVSDIAAVLEDILAESVAN